MKRIQFAIAELLAVPAALALVAACFVGWRELGIAGLACLASEWLWRRGQVSIRYRLVLGAAIGVSLAAGCEAHARSIETGPFVHVTRWTILEQYAAAVASGVLLGMAGSLAPSIVRRINALPTDALAMEDPDDNFCSPVGAANTCPRCGSELLIERSLLLGDTTCPKCRGMLLFLNVQPGTYVFDLADHDVEFRGRLTAILAEALDVTPADLVSGAVTVGDLTEDSLDAVELIMQLEDAIDT